MILVESLMKTYQVGNETIHALDNVSFRVREGDMIAITGSSGSGKSTLMNILGCLDQPDSGRYCLREENVADLSSNRLAEIRNRHIGFIFQSFNLLPRMSALENVELPLLYAGRKEARKASEEALRVVGLGERMYHEPSQLSGGQRQRVAIARAIVTNPTMVLADEPTGNLDSVTTQEIMNILLQLNREGRTILIVTHEMEIANYCPKQIRMRDGKIVEIHESH